NSVKDQTGVEASVDEKGRLVLANRDGRGIKITDGVDKSYDPTGKAFTATEAVKVADKHLLYTNKTAVDTGDNGQVAADLSKAETWKGAGADADTAGTHDKVDSILNSANTFEDVKNAYYEQAARHAADGVAKVSTEAIQKAVKDGTEIDLSAIHAEKLGALNMEFVGTNNAVTTAGGDTYKDMLKDANDAVKAVLGQNTSKHASLADANAKIDDALAKLQKVVDAADGKTMATNEAENGMVAYAAMKFLEGLKEGLNEGDRKGLKEMIGLTNDTKTNFGRLSFSSTNGKDIVVEATRDYVGADDKLHSMDVTSAIG
ncbi:flagellin hook IN motif-containing protein, partial [Campylobacter sp. 2018MI01]|uniref:flagellin hook IN motif-containing protein n=1 Tax=Campylobacter sp. 2018MI01 TaxID=2836735 RepID=UPI00202598B7